MAVLPRRVAVVLAVWLLVFGSLVAAMATPKPVGAESRVISRYSTGYSGVFIADGTPHGLWYGMVRAGETAYMTSSGDQNGGSGGSYVGWRCGYAQPNEDYIGSRLWVIAPGPTPSATLPKVDWDRYCAFVFTAGVGTRVNVYGSQVRLDHNQDYVPPQGTSIPTASPGPSGPVASGSPGASFYAGPTPTPSGSAVCFASASPGAGAPVVAGCPNASPSASPSSTPDPNSYTASCTTTSTCYTGILVFQDGDVVDVHLTAPAPTLVSGTSGTTMDSDMWSHDSASSGTGGETVCHQQVYTTTYPTPEPAIDITCVGVVMTGFGGVGDYAIRGLGRVETSGGAVFSQTFTIAAKVVSGPSLITPSSAPSGSGGASPSGSTGPDCYTSVYSATGGTTYTMPCPTTAGQVGVPGGAVNGGDGSGGTGYGNGSGACGSQDGVIGFFVTGPLSGKCKAGMGAYAIGGDCPFPSGDGGFPDLNPVDYLAWIGCNIVNVLTALKNMAQWVVNALIDMIVPDFAGLQANASAMLAALGGAFPFSMFADMIAAVGQGAGSAGALPAIPLPGGGSIPFPTTEITSAVSPFRGIIGGGAYLVMTLGCIRLLLAALGVSKGGGE